MVLFLGIPIFHPTFSHALAWMVGVLKDIQDILSKSVELLKSLQHKQNIQNRIDWVLYAHTANIFQSYLLRKILNREIDNQRNERN